MNGTAPTLTSVTTSFAGGATTVSLNGTVQAIATCNFSNGTSAACSGTFAVTAWNTSAPSIATVSTAGVVTGVAMGTANIWANAGGITGNVAPINVTNVTLQSLSIATTGNITTLNPGATNQIIAHCTYTNGTTDQCNTPDANGYSVNAYTSTNNTTISVNSTGLLTALTTGSSNIAAYINGSSVSASTLGVTNQDISGGVTYGGSMNTQYMVTGASTGGYTVNSCSIYIPTGTQASGAYWDCVLNQATSPTGQNANALCSARYTTSSTTGPGAWVTVNMTGCGTLPPNTAYWLGTATNQGGPVAEGFYDCGSTCTGSAPTSGVGTYPCYSEALTFGTYTGMSTTLTAGCGPLNAQVSHYLNLSSTASGTINSNVLNLTVLGTNGVTTLQGITIKGATVK
jgi:hypothetical protein